MLLLHVMLLSALIQHLQYASVVDVKGLGSGQGVEGS
jgi:hypothetical protein